MANKSMMEIKMESQKNTQSERKQENMKKEDKDRGDTQKTKSKMADSHLAILTINVNCLNTMIKSQRLS